MCSASMHVCVPCMPSALRDQKRDSETPRTRVKDGGEPPGKCWELSLVALQEQQVLLTAEPSLQSLV